MTNKDKTILIAGMMFNVTFFLSMMMSVFITNAAAIALLASMLTYLFSTNYFTHKRLKVAATTNSKALKKNSS